MRQLLQKCRIRADLKSSRSSVANVRTLALVEVLFAQAISFFIFKQATTRREALGMALIVAGVALLIWVA